MNKKLMIFSVLASLTVSVGASAASKKYGVGGCGLGSILHGPEGNQVMAMTTNGTSGSQTFGISSGTSNCVDSGVVKKNKEARLFIETNQKRLASDISRGRGETVASLAHLLGCQDEGLFSKTLQKSYSSIFPSATVSVDHVEAEIRQVAAELSSCQG